MRVATSHIVVAIVALAALVLPALTYAQAEASWRTVLHDYGTFHETAGAQRCTFVVTNTGDSALVITRVQPTCGCTVADYTTEAIEPGATGSVNVVFTPTGRPGPFEKALWVYTNTAPSKTRLTIQGVVVGTPESVDKYYPEEVCDLRLTRSVLSAGEVNKGALRNSILSAYNATADTILLWFDNNTSHINIIAKPDTIAPGNTSSISFYFDSSHTPLWGINDDIVTMFTKPLGSSRDAMSAPINLVANVVEDFSSLTNEELANAPTCTVEPDKVVLENISSGVRSSTIATVKITNNGAGNLIVRRVMATDRALRVDVDKTLLHPGEQATVTLRVLPERLGSNVLNSQITIISNDPANPRITVRVVGTKR